MARAAALALALVLAALGRGDAARVPLDVWSLRSLNGSLRVAEAALPGSAHTLLQAAGLLEDPYLRFHELDYRWVAEETWVYERNVTLEAPAARARLVFEGLDGPAQVVVNGRTIAHTANSFHPYAFDVSSVLEQPGEPNSIQVVFSPATKYARDAAEAYPYFVPETVNYNVWAEPSHRSFIRKAGSDFGWDWGPAYASTGIAGRVYLETGATSVELQSIDAIVQLHSDDSDHSVATVMVRVPVNTPSFTLHNVTFSAFLNDERQVSLVRSIDDSWTDGDSIELSFSVKNPRLWWPNGYGKPHLYDLRVDAHHPTGTSSVHHKIGFRRVELVQSDTTAGNTTGKTFYFKVNGVPIFAKGGNWIPSDSFPTRANATMTSHLLRSAHAANMNMVRVWGGGRYESDHFYRECDRLGLLVWQELMFACGMYPRDTKFIKSIEEEVRFQLTRLRKYTSIAIWGGNNENENMMEQFVNATFFPPGESFNRDIAVADFSKLFVDVIYPIVKSLDPARPFVDTSPSNGVYSYDPYVKRWGASNSVAFGDVHFYNYDGDCQNFQMYPPARFISEFGFQSAPSGPALRRVSSPSDWESFQSFWKLLKFRERHENGTSQMLAQMERRFHVPFPFRDENWLEQPFGFNDEEKFGFDIAERIDSYLYLTQIQQSLCYQTAIRTWRRGKHHDLGMTMGILYWQLNDIWEGTSWSSMEFSGRWKSLHHVVRREFAPFVVSIFEQPDGSAVGIFGVSDINADIDVRLYYELRRTTTGALVKTILTEEVQLTPLESKPIRQLHIQALLDEQKTDCTRLSCFLYIRCLVDGSPGCEDTYYFLGPYKKLLLSSGTINAVVTPAAEPTSFEVTIESSNFLALFVELDLPGWRGIWSGNSFLMFGNSTRTLRFTLTDDREPAQDSDEVAAALAEALEIRWLQRIYGDVAMEIAVE